MRCRAEVSRLHQRISQPVKNDLQDKLSCLLSRCEASDESLQSVTARIDQMEQITSQLAETQHSQPSLPPPPPQDIPPEREVIHDTKESKDDIESMKSFVSEKVASMKDLVSGPLSVIFDAVRSDDFVGEDNFLTYSKAAIYHIIQLNILFSSNF